MTYHLAQLNIAQMRYPIDSPEMSDFVARIEEINALAEVSPGFVWRLIENQNEANNALSFRPFDDTTLVNMSVWESVKALHDYVYHSAHIEVMRRQKEWFSRLKSAHQVLWWLPAGDVPTLDDAKAKLELLRQHGASAKAFGFKSVFSPPSAKP